jgi:hypothetical protein
MGNTWATPGQHLGSLTFSLRKIHAPNEEKVMFKAMTKVDDDLRSLLRVSQGTRIPQIHHLLVDLGEASTPEYVYLPYYSHGREAPGSVAVQVWYGAVCCRLMTKWTGANNLRHKTQASTNLKASILEYPGLSIHPGVSPSADWLLFYRP